jgi:two-component system, LytTR family, response regulator
MAPPSQSIFQFYLTDMSILSAFIIEDEKHNRDSLINLLSIHCSATVAVAGSAPSISEAIAFLQHHEVDILFLDIELSDGQVFDLFNYIDYEKYRLIFTTGYSEHAIRAIRFSATDYLLKPIVINELTDAVYKAMKREAHETNPILSDFIKRKQFELGDYLIVNNLHAVEHIPLNSISRLKADGVYTVIFHGKEKTISSKSLGVYEDILPVREFNRCHKSYIVNRTFVRRVIKGRGLELVLEDGTEIPVSIRKKEAFTNWFRQKH